METKIDVREKKLIARVQNKEIDAFEEIIKKYELEIYNYILKMIRDEMLAMDLLQETVLKAYKYLDNYDSKYSFKVWLYTLAKNNVIDETRKKYYHQKKQTDSFSDPHIQVPGKEDYDQVEFESLKEALEAAVNKLPDQLRSIITLCDIMEMSYEEAAAVEQINIGTVKSRLNRARNALKQMKHLKEYL